MLSRLNLRRIASIACLCWVASCERPRGELTVIENDMPVQPAVTTEATEAMRAAPSRSSALRDGACATQDDCGADELCVASAPGAAECIAQSDAPELQASPRGPLGQPAPPIGLLDGQAMRDHAERSMP
jgi:hypothetical protein